MCELLENIITDGNKYIPTNGLTYNIEPIFCPDMKCAEMLTQFGGASNTCETLCMQCDASASSKSLEAPYR